MDDWEETACPLCAGTTADVLVDTAPWRVVRCRDCRLAYTNPRPSRHSIGRFYPDDYAPHQLRLKDGRHSPFLAVLPPAGRLLDFGCGAGRLLRQMHARGWQVTGIDAAPRMVRHVHEQLGLRAVEGTLPHPDLPPGSFEAITMAEALEHVHDPLGVLRAAHALLTPGGKLAISVPNIDSLPFKWFGAAWFGLDVPRHLTHFEPRTLRQMLERAGFRIQRVQPIRHNSWLRHSAQQALGWRRLLRYRLPASIAGWYSAWRRQSNGMLAVAVRD